VNLDRKRWSELTPKLKTEDGNKYR